MASKAGLKAEIKALTTSWGSGDPALFGAAKRHEKELLKLLCRIVDATPRETLKELGRKYDEAEREYVATIAAVDTARGY